MSTARWRLPLHIPVAVLFSLLILGVGATISLRHFHDTRVLLEAANGRLFENLALEAERTLAEANWAVARSFILLSASPLADARTHAERLQYLPELADLLAADSFIESVMVGYGDGGLFLVRQAEASDPRAGWIVEDHGGDGADGPPLRLRFDGDLRFIDSTALGRATEPRLEAWYRNAAVGNQLAFTAPHAFAHSGAHGVTFSQRNGTTVLAANIDFSAVSRLLARHALTPSTDIRLMDETGAVLAASGITATRSPGPIPEGVQPAAGRSTMEIDGRHWQRSVAAIPGFGTASWQLVVAAPDDELFAEAYRQRERATRFTTIAILLAFPLAWGLSRLLTRPLDRLAGEARMLSALRFQPAPDTRSVILEVDQLAGAMEMMRGAISRFLEMGRDLGSARDVPSLLAQVEAGAREVAGARWSRVLADDGGAHRPPDRLHWQSAEAAATAEAPPNDGDTLAPLLAADAPASLRLRSGDGRPWQILALPLATPQGEVLGTLLLADRDGRSAGFARAEVVGFLEALAGSAAVALENQRLLKGRKDLLQGVIRMVAAAIDAKSPYTGGHCRRVPEIARRLTRAAHEAEDGPFAGYHLDAAGWETLEIAAWLHDCGKLTTPEYVIDKATKLETLYNRIHEIRTRFEVLKRDAEIAYWRGLAEGGEENALRAERDRAWRALDEDFAFVARCNRGSEGMPATDQARLEAIAGRRWRRTLDDRLGLSNAELARCVAVPPAPLPADEPLLADRATDLIARDNDDTFAPDNPWGFVMRPPAHLYNHGELHNLRVERGTLTEEERFKIKEHIVETIIMLSRLPFPADLAAVPEVAGSHHETMDGRGYPRGQPARQLSVTARIMAIADIFEALTANDRPYKRANTIAETLAIMEDMCRRDVIDAELFALFRQQALWRGLVAEADARG